MATIAPPLGRPDERTRLIVRTLRQRIVEGELGPGAQFPTRTEIEKFFGASSVTVQRALEQLRREGFVEVNGRKGTFVAEEPPHLNRYAVVFPYLPTDSFWLRFWTALNNEAVALQREKGRDLSIYHGIQGHSNDTDYLRLVQEVQSHRIAGIVFASTPKIHLTGTPLTEEPNVPRVAICSKPIEGMAAVVPSTASFLKQALDDVVAQGRKRVGILLPTLYSSDIAAMVAERDLIMHPYWCQPVNLTSPQTARVIMHLMMHEGQRERPDALIIADDNLVEHATSGLIDAGVRVPDDVYIVGHCNFPQPVPSVLPMRRIGFDARKVMAACVESIDRQRRGEIVPPITAIAAQCEEDVRD